MKKSVFLLFVLASLLGVNSMFAQTVEERKIKEPEKVEFNPHWFMQIQGGIGHTVGETKFKDLLSPAAALNFGYQFNPLFGLRAGVSGWQAKGAWVANPRENYKYKYLQFNVDAMLNVSELFCDFNPERTFNLYAFLGAGFNHGFDNDEAVALANKGADMQYLWKDSKNFLAGRGGLALNIRLSDRVGLNVEGNANVLSDKFNSKKAGNLDWQFNALIGLNIKLGKGYTRTPAVYYEPEPVPAPAPKKEVVKEEPKPAPVVEKPEKIQRDIFFTINRSKVRENQMSKIDELVSYLNKYPNAKISIVGYADKKTGNATINSRLSKERALAVSQILQEKGISASRIVTDSKGDTVQPFAVNEENRVSICIAEE